MTDLAVVYEHPEWFRPLFGELDRRGVDYLAVRIDDHVLDLDETTAPARVVFNRLAMSSFLRQGEHAIFYAQAVFAHWAACGARVINGIGALAIDTSKARQLTLIRSLGLHVPKTRVVHRVADVWGAANGLGYPLIVKPNIGGSGSGVMRHDSAQALRAALDAGSIALGIDGVALVQEYVPTSDGRVFRAETLGGKFLYAIALNAGGATFDLCPADVCAIDRPPVTMVEATLDAATIAEVESIAQAAQLDVGGIEFMLDARDGTRRWYDINGLSNFVADPLRVLGWEPHERLVDFLIAQIAHTPRTPMRDHA